MTKNPSSQTELLVGFLCASLFSLAYVVIPAYLVFALVSVYYWPTSTFTLVVLAPVLASALTKPVAMHWLLRSWAFQCVLKYFDFWEHMEMPQDEFVALMRTRPVLVGFHPHGIFPFTGLCCAIKWSRSWWSPDRSTTAVADAVMATPLLKHVIGVLGITSASSASLDRALREKDSVVLYPGGTAELFLTNHLEERIHLLDRKGFVRVALKHGCALVPTYLFGNTQTLRVLQWPWLQSFSRKTGVAMTYLYGRFYLPLPLPSPCVAVMGQPLLLPQIDDPTPSQVDEWHAKYVHEVRRLFAQYKHQVPGYEHKELIVM